VKVYTKGVSDYICLDKTLRAEIQSQLGNCGTTHDAFLSIESLANVVIELH